MEQGKTLIDAEGDVTRGLRKIYDVICLMPNIHIFVQNCILLINFLFQRLLRTAVILLAQSWANHYHW